MNDSFFKFSKEYGLYVTIALFLGKDVWRMIILGWRKYTGEYVGHREVRELKARVEELERTQHHQVVVISNQKSEIETLRIVSEKMIGHVKEIVDELKSDIKETKDDMRQVREILLRRQ